MYLLLADIYQYDLENPGLATKTLEQYLAKSNNKNVSVRLQQLKESMNTEEQ